MNTTPDKLSAYMNSRDPGNPGDMAYRINDDVADIARAKSALTRYHEGAKSKFSWIVAMYLLVMKCGVTPPTAYRWLKGE